jgi:hypothetical protein
MNTKDQEKSTTTDVDSLFRDLFSQELSTNDSQSGTDDVTQERSEADSERITFSSQSDSSDLRSITPFTKEGHGQSLPEDELL